MLEQGRILVVDDEEVMREFLSEVFASQNPLCAKDGAEAMQLIGEHPISLIITDLRMPGVDGLELLRRVRALDREIKVIIITGYSSLEMSSECIQLGASDFLKKPFSISQIRAAVEKVMSAA